jgi:hypothetical protein
VVILEGVVEVVTNPDPAFSERVYAASVAKYGMGCHRIEGSYAVRPRVAFGWARLDADRHPLGVERRLIPHPWPDNSIRIGLPRTALTRKARRCRECSPPQVVPECVGSVGPAPPRAPGERREVYEAAQDA